jgi:DNA-directed RNA polymerase specialized sigma24 family protein
MGAKVAPMAVGFRKDWWPTRSGFREFLQWLDEGVESSGEKYLETRRRLVQYFDRKNCLSPDELADETLHRVARRLAEEGGVTDVSPAHYCYIVARFVFLEYQRRPGRTLENLDRMEPSPFVVPEPKGDSEEKLFSRLESCLEKLKPDHRQLILEYYRGDQRAKIDHRRDLAKRLGLTMNALSIRACRIRTSLEECVKKRFGGHE